ncbi:hypothetical protein [Singulisphaera acidiphila]|uniref:Uncharacterized protein n=1 Tax=Singulisphaera acidiphila (strain ATCC BAA-1392 / DSM 18658 / VKM B-2454 / MOB10) TaxID=886293 RepID=L0DLL6_SINAD|nr:hypothetical protein [Singulisphaera acidiphila]AGA30279.1 hypothetical protein Sinac_6180 [Singulisphaera acidiphila DSM 18658]
MNAALSLFALALLGADSSPNQGTLPIQYRVKLLEMDGLKWRESIYTRLQPVARQGTCAIWTANQDVIKPLVDQASRVLMNPQVMADPNAVAAYSQRTTRKVASQLTRHADGPVDHAVAVAYTTDHEDLREGCQFTMSGRKLDQGMLVRMVVEETRIAAIHQVKLTEFVPKKDDQGEQTILSPKLDVPEVVKGTLEGEWLIPNSGVLVASLGAHTIDDGNGKAVIRERLMLIEAAPVTPRTTVDLSQALSRSFTFVAPARVSTIPMPNHLPIMPGRVPIAPSRSLPIARAADGTPVPLPPLPESQVPPTSFPGTSEPCATPQTAPQPKSASDDTVTPHVKDNEETKSIDLESHRVGYYPEASAADTLGASARGFWSTIKPYLLRLPLGPGIDIELSATVKPSIKP